MMELFFLKEKFGYKLRTTQYFEKETLGITKGMEELFL
jgi:hypothetical protein